MTFPVTVISKERADEVCRMGQGRVCCIFVGDAPQGLVCLKRSVYATEMIQRKLMGQTKAKGDNCSGPPDFKETTQ